MPVERKKVIYFCDETSHIDDVYMAVGGIAINLNSIAEIESELTEIRNRFHIGKTREIKWNNAKARRNVVHFEYAELLYRLVQENRLHFHIRFQKIGDWDHEKSGPRRKTDTVSRAYYQLLLHRPVGFYGKSADILVRPDNGECTEKLKDYVGHLNSEARSKKGCLSSPIHSVECRDSKQTHGLQLLDVTLGALAALRNERHLRPELSSVKKELAEHVFHLWGELDLTKSSPLSSKKFNVWNVRSPASTAPKG